jgi:hypothetical protein
METNSFSNSYISGRIPILSSEKKFEGISARELKKDINVLIACIEDTDARCAAVQYLEDIQDEVNLLEQFSTDLIACQSVMLEN